MRRLIVTALCGTLLLAACSDQTRESPTEPTVLPPEAQLGTCRPERFPIVKVTALILKVFPAGKLRIEALARAAAITILWDTCRQAPARKAAVEFVAFMGRNSAALKGTPEQRNTLISLILNGVGIPTTVSDDFGVGLFDPNNPNKTLIKTRNSRALVQLDVGSFLEPTVVTIGRLADGFQLTNFDGDQFPPKYDYNAVNSSGNHVLQAGKTAVIAFCLLSLEEFGLEGVYPPGGYPENRRIGHNPVLGAPGFPFEVLDEVDLAEAELDDDLDCPTGISSLGPQGSGFANAALRTANRYLGPIFLPQRLWAATLGKLPPPPPIGGKAGSLSPFAVVEFTENELSITSDPSDHNDNSNYFKSGVIDRCDDGCDIEVQILDGEGEPTGVGTLVKASLIEVAVSEGAEPVLGGDDEQPVQEGSLVAAFDDLTISEPGRYRLKFEAPGATSVTSEEFDVYTLNFTLQPQESVTEGSMLGQPLTGFDSLVVQVSIVDHDGDLVGAASDNIVAALNTDLELDGTTSINAEAGVANFTQIESDGEVFQSGLRVFLDGCTPLTDLELTASADGVVQDNSSPFDVTPDC